MARFLIVEARFYEHLNDMLIAGARAAIEGGKPRRLGDSRKAEKVVDALGLEPRTR